MMTIEVIAGADRYPVIVGPLADNLRQIGSASIVVSEPRVFGLHGAALAAIGAGSPILLPEGEAAKTWDVLHSLLAELAARNASRATSIVAFGGGSVGDVAGLAASLFKRGCPVIHVPTTLLSQADSAVGGKTAIDAFGEKNVIGSFHQPDLVLADPALLATLDPRQLRSGYAEIVKYGLIDDLALFDWCEAHGASVIADEGAARTEAIAAAVRAKARIVTSDVRDLGGVRALLNLGHSFAHAIESEAGLGVVLHGEAVALGMVLALQLSVALGLSPSRDASRVSDHLRSVGLPTSLAEVGVAGPRLLEWMMRDKKNISGGLTLILTRGIGQAFVAPGIDPARLAAFLEAG